MSDKAVAGLAFVERDESLVMSRANHQISLPVAEALAGVIPIA